ncbi:MAG: tyrosine-type recombinase/integrase [Oscillospiraceae bacterium]|nr:tyrosine-type recombinase/integrase [Oscillospiraceae bacterium]
MRTEYLLQKEVERVLDLLTYENRLVMRVLLHTGLRISDALQLKPEQLRPNFWVTEQKTGKRRQVGLPEPLLADLRDSADGEWVFPGSKPGKHRTRQAVWKDVKRAAAALRLTQNAAPHSARKVYAVELLKKYGDIDRVRRALNHGGLEVTLIYAMADKQLTAAGRRRRGKPGRKRA